MNGFFIKKIHLNVEMNFNLLKIWSKNYFLGDHELKLLKIRTFLAKMILHFFEGAGRKRLVQSLLLLQK